MGRKIRIRCGTVTRDNRRRALELALWILGILPGLIFTMIRRRTDPAQCPKCGGDLYPVDSHAGAAIARHFDGRQ